MIDVSAIEETFASIVSQLANLAGELRSARILTDNSTDQCEIEDALRACEKRIRGRLIKKFNRETHAMLGLPSKRKRK